MDNTDDSSEEFNGIKIIEEEDTNKSTIYNEDERGGSNFSGRNL